MKRILISSKHSNPEAVKVALKSALEEAMRNGSGTIILLVPVLRGWESGQPAEVLGKAATRALLKNGFINLTDQIRLEIHSPGTLKKRAPGVELLAIHVSPETIEAATASKVTYKTCVYLPWMPEETEAWRQLPADEIKEVPLPVQN